MIDKDRQTIALFVSEFSFIGCVLVTAICIALIAPAEYSITSKVPVALIIFLGLITGGLWYIFLIFPFKAHWPILIPAYFIVLLPALDYRGKTYDAWYGQSFWMMTFFIILCIIATVKTYKLRRKYHIR